MRHAGFMEIGMPRDTLELLRQLGERLKSDYHVGVMVPWANQAVERELADLRPKHLHWHFARLVPANLGTALDDDFLTGLIRAVPGALAQLSRLPLAESYVACTSAGFSFGLEFAAATASAPRPCLSAFDAVIETLRLLNAKQVVLVTPYPISVGAKEEEAFVAEAIAVTQGYHLGEADNYPEILQSTVLKAIDSVSSNAIEHADAIVLSCTGWLTLEALEVAQQRYGKPVISSNLAMVLSAVLRQLRVQL